MTEQRSLPQHIAIIMDGNGRWAKQRGLPRNAGHRKGISRIKEIIKAVRELGIKYLTLFAFSHENWDRPQREVDMLMRALDNFLKKELANLNKDNIRLRFIGRDSPIPLYLQERIKSAQEDTRDNSGLTLIIALNYGARQEIIDAVRRYAAAVARQEESLELLDETRFSQFLYTAKIPDPDLLIRTSGELRISNFLLWQLSYSELYFLDKFWPDFSRQDLVEAIDVYQKRERRFGRI